MMAKFFMDGKLYDTERAEKVFSSRSPGFMFELPKEFKIYHTELGNWFSTEENCFGVKAQTETEESVKQILMDNNDVETYERLFGEVERA